MRKVGRHRRNKQKKILIIGSMSLLLFLCVGYAAFSTNLSLKAKGNIKELSGAKVLRKKCNTESGDGLYKDIYEDDKCIFKGTNPNNYITFNDDEAGWRILSIESDNTIKIIKSSSIGNIQWNTSNANFENSYIQKYLNENFFSTIIKNEDKIQIHSWNIGNIKFNNDNLYEQINDEKNLQSQPIRIGLITVSEYLNANINVSECGNLLLNNTNREKCVLTNWIYSITPNKGWLWTITSGNISNNVVYSIHSTDGNVGYVADYYVTEYRGVSPVLYLKSDTILSGIGTKQNPYEIIN